MSPKLVNVNVNISFLKFHLQDVYYLNEKSVFCICTGGFKVSQPPCISNMQLVSFYITSCDVEISSRYIL